MLPAPYYHLHYDENSGEVIGFWNPNSSEIPEPNILVDLETHARVLSQTFMYRVRNGKVVSRDEQVQDENAPAPVMPKRDIQRALIAGLVVDGVCYAIAANPLSVLTLDLAANAEEVRAITYTKDGTRLVKLSRADAENVASKIAEHLSDLFVG